MGVASDVLGYVQQVLNPVLLTRGTKYIPVHSAGLATAGGQQGVLQHLWLLEQQPPQSISAHVGLDGQGTCSLAAEVGSTNIVHLESRLQPRHNDDPNFQLGGQRGLKEPLQVGQL